MKNNKKFLALLVSAVLLLTVAVGGTLAYLVTSTDVLTNIFTPAQVSCEVWENGGTTGYDNDEVSVSQKDDIKIKNTGNTDAYIRVMVIPTIQDSSGNLVYIAGYTIPELPDPDTGWVKSGDYYYYTASVSAGDSTTELFDSAISKPSELPSDYHLVVDVIADAIQAEPFEDYTEAWNTAMDITTGGSN